MNLLFVADVSIARVGSGAERVLFEQATRLAAVGNNVHLLTAMDKTVHRQEKERISGVLEWRYRTDSRHPLRYLFDTLTRGGRLFRRLHREIGFDLVFFHQPLSACAVLFSGAGGSLEKIYTCHSLWHEEYMTRTLIGDKLPGKHLVRLPVLARKQVERYVLNNADQIIALSRYTRNKLLKEQNIQKEKVSVVPGGVDLERFHPSQDRRAVRQRLGFCPEALILFSLRNLEPRMGLAGLLRAMEGVVSELPDVYLVIGGEGPLKASLMEQTQRSGLASHVFFTGFIDDSVLPDYYRMADFFVLPTIDLEGFGLVTLEAMASGTPVLGTPVGGTLEILEAFDSAFLFADSSSRAMTRLISEMCRRVKSDPEKFEAIRRKTRAFVEDRYSWTKNINQMMALADDGSGRRARKQV